MAAIPELSFGDFSKEEFDIYLSGHSCVELPPLLGEGELVTDGFLNGNNSETTLCFFNAPILKDDNENHIISQLTENYKGTLDAIQVPLEPHSNNVRVPNGVASPEELNNQCTNEGKPHSTPNEAEIFNDSKTDTMVNGHLSETDESNDTQKSPEYLVNGDVIQNKDPVPSDNNSSDTTDLTKEDEPIVASPPAKEKSWASLFSGPSKQTSKPPKPTPVVKSEPTAVTSSEPTAKENLQNKKKVGSGTAANGWNARSPQLTEVVEVAHDMFSKQIADQISKNEIVYKSPGLMPRGFINSSNWCYINATLQALLTSSPFCHLMRSLPSRQPSPDANVMITSTPILDSFVRLVKELKPLPKKGFQRAGKEQFQGTSYEPEYIYKMLSTIKSKFSEKGRQEDAEEFLSCVLNGLHEEMLKVYEFHYGKNVSAHGPEDTSPRGSQSELGYEVPVHEDDADDSNEENDQWEEVTATRKNRSSVTRRADISKTPVSDVFRGELRSDLFQEGLRATATLEPFFTLPLDINDQKPRWSVNEALEHLTRMETVQDFTNAKTKVKGEATRKITLETLPPVLILHLKRFIYDKEGGSLKIDKEVQYHTDLVIGKELLSKSSKKLSQEKRSYKLFAVVYHHGKAATGGHYTTDVYHDGLNCWLRIDDQAIKMSKVHDVVRHDPQRTAYLLYYKRTDLMAV